MGSSNKGAAAAGVGAGLGGALGAGIAKWANKDLYDQQDQLQDDDYQSYMALHDPMLQKLRAEQQGPSAFEDVREDPSTLAAQRAALARMANIAGQGGMDAIGRSQLEEGRQAASGMAAGANAALRSRMASRGMMGSGAELAAEAGNGQAAAQRLSQSGYAAAAGAQQRNMQAINGSAGIAGDMRGQDYKRQADLAASRDAINFHNMQNRTDANRYNALLPQQMYEDTLQTMKARSAARQRKSGYLGDKAQSNVDTGQGIGEGVGGAAGMAVGGGFGG